MRAGGWWGRGRVGKGRQFTALKNDALQQEEREGGDLLAVSAALCFSSLDSESFASKEGLPR